MRIPVRITVIAVWSASALCSAPIAAQQLDWFVLSQPTLDEPRMFTMTVDPAGNLYTGGDLYAGDDMDPGPGVVAGNITGGCVRKLDADGAYQWCVAFAEVSNGSYCRAEDMAIDATGNIIIVGKLAGTIDFDPSPAQALRTSTGNWNTFVCKLDPSGNLLWVVDLAYTGWNTRVAIDGADNICVGGFIQDDADFDPGPGDHTLAPTGNSAGFIWKLDTAGNYVWAGLVNGTVDVLITDIAVDAGNNLIAAGWQTGTADLDPGVDYHASTLQRFVIKLQPSGDLAWAVELPHDYALGLAVDGEGNVIVSGTLLGFNGPYDFDPGAGTFELFAAASPFLWKLSPQGDLVWAKLFGDAGSSTEGVWVTTDAADHAIISGRGYGNIDLDPGPDSTPAPGAVDHNFFSVLDAQGNFVSGGFITHQDDEADDDAGRNWAWQPVADAVGNIYIGGYAWGTMDFDPGPGQSTVTNNALYHGNHMPSGFVVKLGTLSTAVAGTRNEHFTIYPVPVQDILHIATNEPILRASLSDMSGRAVGIASSGTAQLDVHDLPSGCYVLEVITRSARMRRSVIKR